MRRTRLSLGTPQEHSVSARRAVALPGELHEGVHEALNGR